MKLKLQLDYKDLGWWYWVASWIFIVTGLLGWEPGFLFVVQLSAWQIVHYIFIEKSLKSFSVQVRMGFFLLTLIGLWQPLRFIYWLPAFGLLARILINYCLLARVMSLLPWNCGEPLSAELVRRRIFSPPVKGSILKEK